jgi:hypothetical protein
LEKRLSRFAPIIPAMRVPIGNWDWPEIYERSKEPTRQSVDSVRGLGASAGVVERHDPRRRFVGTRIATQKIKTPATPYVDERIAHRQPVYFRRRRRGDFI